MAVKLWNLGGGRPLPPGRSLILISVRVWVYSRAIVRLEGLGKLKKKHLIGTRSRDFPACSIVPQSTTLPRARSCVMEWSYLCSYSNFKDNSRVLKALWVRNPVQSDAHVPLLHDHPKLLQGSIDVGVTRTYVLLIQSLSGCCVD
jgi:hypothetical protein